MRDAPRERQADAAEDARCEQLREGEWESALAREEPPEHKLSRRGAGNSDARQSEPTSSRAAGNSNADEHDCQEQKGDRARCEGEQYAGDEPDMCSALQRPEGEQRERDTEREREGRGKYDARPDDGEGAARPAGGRSPLPTHDERERQRS